MEFALIIYAIDTLGTAKSMLGGLAVIWVIASGIVWALQCINAISNTPTYKFKHVWISLSMAAVSVLIPAKQVGYMMLGGYVAQKTVQSELGEKLYKIALLKLDGYIGEMTKEAQNVKK